MRGYSIIQRRIARIQYLYPRGRALCTAATCTPVHRAALLGNITTSCACERMQSASSARHSVLDAYSFRRVLSSGCEVAPWQAVQQPTCTCTCICIWCNIMPRSFPGELGRRGNCQKLKTTLLHPRRYDPKPCLRLLVLCDSVVFAQYCTSLYFECLMCISVDL